MSGTFALWMDALLVLLSLSLALCFVRLYLGPTTPDRAISFDLIAVHAVGMLVLSAIRYEQPVMLDVAIVTAVLGFLGTVMVAHYVEAAPHGSEENTGVNDDRA